MNKHTPGNWFCQKSHLSRPESIRLDIVTDAGEYSPAFIAGDALPADAALICAAPEILEALQAIVSDYSALMRSQGASADIGAPSSPFTAGEWVGSRLGAHIAKAQSIISKAKGEA